MVGYETMAIGKHHLISHLDTSSCIIPSYCDSGFVANRFTVNEEIGKMYFW